MSWRNARSNVRRGDGSRVGGSPVVEGLEGRRLLAASGFPVGLGGIDVDTGERVATDFDGNVLVAGMFHGTVDFDPGAGTAALTAPGGDPAAYIAKYNPDMTLVWARTVAVREVTGLGADRAGNVYVGGSFAGTVDFDLTKNGVLNVTSSHQGIDAFMFKLTPTGSTVYARKFGGLSTDRGTALAVSYNGNVALGGQFRKTGDFDPRGGQFPMSTNGGFDVFEVLLTPTGNLIWARSFGGPADPQGQAVEEKLLDIAIDDAGAVVATGYYNAAIDFDPGAGTDTLIATTQDAFVNKLDANGDHVWAHGIGGLGQDFGSTVAVDRDGNVYTAGMFTGTADFDPSGNSFNVTANGLGQTYVSKLNADGTFGYGKAIGGGSGTEGPGGIAVDKAQSVYVSGRFRGTADFDPGAGTTNLTSSGASDVFMAKLNSSGGLVWAKSMGGATVDQANDLTLDRIGNVFSTGQFTGTADFDPGAGTDNLVSNGADDAFVTRLDNSGALV